MNNSWLLHAGAADYCFVPNFNHLMFTESRGSVAERDEKLYKVDGKAKKRKLIIDLFKQGKTKYEISHEAKASYSYINVILLKCGLIEIAIRKNTKKVLQYTPDGEFVAEYDNPLMAAIAVGTSITNIRQTCTGVKGRTMAKGFIFKYKEE